MKRSLRVRLVMPGATAPCALVVLAAVVGLTGCTTDKHITEVKALAFSYPSDNVQDPNMTVDQALDYRKICDSVKWKVDETEQHQTFVEYNCDYKNVKDSSFLANSLEEAKVKNPSATGVVRIGDVYQWVYGADGRPVLSYVTLRYQFANGTSKDVTQSDIAMGVFRLTGTGWMTTLMQQAVENTAIDYDHFYSQLYGKSIPPMPIPLIKPASPITKSTFANTVTALYPGKSPAEAAALAYRWIGSPVKIQGVNALGYPTQAATCRYNGEMIDEQGMPSVAGAIQCNVVLNHGPGTVYDEAQFMSHLLPVDPQDVQTAIRIVVGLTQARFHEYFVQLSPTKLLCANYLCFDRDGNVVGLAPTSVFDKEANGRNPDFHPSQSMANTETAPPTPVPAVAPATSVPTAVATDVASDDVDAAGWPKDTPCIKTLRDKFATDREKENLDSTVSLDQAQEWADVCKSLGK